MEELLRFIVESLVDNKEAINIDRREEDDAIVFEVTVDEGETGMLIGKGGKIAQAIRSIMHSASRKENKKYIIKIK